MAEPPLAGASAAVVCVTAIVRDHGAFYLRIILPGAARVHLSSVHRAIKVINGGDRAMNGAESKQPTCVNRFSAYAACGMRRIISIRARARARVCVCV